MFDEGYKKRSKVRMKAMETLLDEAFNVANEEVEESKNHLIKYVVVASFISGFLGGGVFVGLYLLTN